MLKKCLDCGSSYEGRADKKFCSDYCRSNYHNHQNISANRHIRFTNQILRKNRSILEGFIDKGSAKISINALLFKGFHFDYFTTIYQCNKGLDYFFCYDLGYHVTDDEQLVLLVRKDSL